MTADNKAIPVVLAFLVKAVMLAGRWVAQMDRNKVTSLSARGGLRRDLEILILRNKVRQLESQVAILQGQLRSRSTRPRYSPRERLAILWHLARHQIPRRRVTELFGVARSTLYRWLHRIEDQATSDSVPVNKTPEAIADWVWKIAMANVTWGRTRIAHQLRTLKVFIAASTVRCILARPRPRSSGSSILEASPPLQTRPKPSIVASYPNHVWSIDRTIVRRWGLWPTYVLVAIDHCSRKVVVAASLEGPNAGFVCEALESAFHEHGPPKHIITDQESVFTGEAFKELLCNWDVKLRHGAVGRHGSIAVTEKVIGTLKHEWLFRVPLIRGIDHLGRLCSEFAEWYNGWRPHARHDGATPDQVYRRDLPEHVPKTAKTVPVEIEERVFRKVDIVGFRLGRAA